jgi:hypothetical protein
LGRARLSRGREKIAVVPREQGRQCQRTKAARPGLHSLQVGSSIRFASRSWRVAASILKLIPAHESALLEASEGGV